VELKDVFGKVLRQHRTKAGLSQEDLALDAGFNRTYISMLERGLRQPTLTTLFKLGKELKISPSELVKEVEQDKDLEN
jgi:transcriptional regulator with XRE-family HTH domain